MPDDPIRSWVRPGRVTQSFFISDIWTRYVKIFAFLPFLFMFLRTRTFPSEAINVPNWFFQKLIVVWPALESQRGAIRTSLGGDQAAWFEGFFLMLCLSLLLPLGRMFVEIFRRANDVMDVQATDAVMLMIFLFCDPYVLFGDTPGRNLIYDFFPDQWGIFYLRQSVAFSVIAWSLLCITFYAWRFGGKVWHMVSHNVETKNQDNSGGTNG